jgi:hypothetical protein
MAQEVQEEHHAKKCHKIVPGSVCATIKVVQSRGFPGLQGWHPGRQGKIWILKHWMRG